VKAVYIEVKLQEGRICETGFKQGVKMRELWVIRVVNQTR